MTDGKAALIIRGLSGEHLAGFLPGEDNRSAISHAVSGHHQWSADMTGAWGQVTRQGIGVWSALGLDKPSEAILFVPWSEVLTIVAKGCADGRREAYEAALADFAAWARAEHDYPPGGWPKPTDHARYAQITEASHATTAAIIDHGCVASVSQMTIGW